MFSGLRPRGKIDRCSKKCHIHWVCAKLRLLWVARRATWFNSAAGRWGGSDQESLSDEIIPQLSVGGHQAVHRADKSGQNLCALEIPLNCHQREHDTGT